MAHKKEQDKSRLPENPEAVKKVVATVLAHPEMTDRVIEIVESQDLGEATDHQSIFEACLSLRSRGIPVTAANVAQEISERGEEIETDIDALYDDADPDSVESLAKEVRRCSILKQMCHAGNSLASQSLNGKADPQKIIQDMKAWVNEMEQKVDTLGGLRITGMEITTSNPTKYRLNFNRGPSVPLDLDDIFNISKVKRAIANVQYELPSLPKDRDWETLMRQLLASATKVEAPEDANVYNEVIEALRDMFEGRGEAQEASDFAQGSYTIDTIDGKRYYLFQRNPVLNYLKQHVDKNMTTSRLWHMLASMGALSEKSGRSISKWVGGSPRHQLWALPAHIIEGEERKEGGEEQEEVEGTTKPMEMESGESGEGEEDMSWLDEMFD